jgi:outer membrane immunogenic protein
MGFRLGILLANMLAILSVESILNTRGLMMRLASTARWLFSALLAFSLSGAAAHAGGLRGGSLKDEPYKFSWTGAYIGITAGYGWGDSRFFDDGIGSNSFDIDGFVLGGTLGYNFHRDNILIGVEADLSYSGISGSFGPGNLGQPGGGFWGCGSGACVTDINWFGTLRGRLGFTADDLLVFATGGLAYGDVDSQIRNAPTWRTGGTEVGWVVGGGIEYALRPGWTAKLEYLHVDLGRTDRTSPEGFQSESEFDVVRFGLNYRLGY